jgi:uncharacterized protein (UPF0210 family)
MSRRPWIACALLLLAVALAPVAGQAAEKPKVRAITGFVRLERSRYIEQIQAALKVLRQAKAAYEQAGYEVQSIRISTQPFPEYTRGLTTQEALAFFREYDALAQKEDFAPAIGPALLDGSDDARAVELLREILLHTNLNASLTVAGEDGVRWKAVRAAAELIKDWSEHSPGGIANFNFAATAVVPPYTPFYPGSYHTGEGEHFAVALQSANVVAEAFASSRDFGQARQALSTALGAHAQAIEAIAQRVEKETGWKYEGIDLSPAPLRDVSIGGAIEGFTGAKFGSSGTMTAAALITGVARVAGQARRLLRVDGPCPGGCGAGATVERRDDISRCPAGLLRRVRHRARHGATARRGHG